LARYKQAENKASDRQRIPYQIKSVSLRLDLSRRKQQQEIKEDPAHFGQNIWMHS